MLLRCALLVAAIACAGCVGIGDAPSSEAGAGGVGADDAGWPPLDAAVVRPGVEIVFLGPVLAVEQEEVAGCTANFVFASPDNRSLYVGTAAHCVDGLAVGDEVAFAKGAARGTLAYSSFLTMDAAGESDDALLEENDFALVRVLDEDRGLVHPAVLHFGGPTGLAASGTLRAGDRILMYGNTDLRPDVEPTKHHGGCVTGSSERITRAHWFAPTMGGDSGSPVLTLNGAAAGLHRGSFWSVGEEGLFEAVNLDAALAYAREHAQVDVRLATWPLITAASAGDYPCGLPE